MVLRRQRSRFTLLILTILCWRGVAKQPQGNEWDSNSGDLQKCSQNTADALHQITEINADCLDSSMRFVDFICNEFKYEYTSDMFDIPCVCALCPAW